MKESQCICRSRGKLDEFMVACDHCQGWFHGSCVGLTSSMAKSKSSFICPPCRKKVSLKKPSKRPMWIDISQKRRPVLQKALPSKPSNQRIKSDSETEDDELVISDPETVDELMTDDSSEEITILIEDSESSEEEEWPLNRSESSEAESEEELLDMVVSEHFSIYNNWSSEEERWISEHSDQELIMIELPPHQNESDTEEDVSDRHGYESDDETMDEETEEEKDQHAPVPYHQQPFKVKPVSPLQPRVESFDNSVELLRNIAKQNKEPSKPSSDQLMDYLLNASKKTNDKNLLPIFNADFMKQMESLALYHRQQGLDHQSTIQALTAFAAAAAASAFGFPRFPGNVHSKEAIMPTPISSPELKRREMTEISIDELLDTGKLEDSKSEAEEPNDLSRWEKVPVTAFRRSRQGTNSKNIKELRHAVRGKLRSLQTTLPPGPRPLISPILMPYAQMIDLNDKLSDFVEFGMPPSSTLDDYDLLGPALIENERKRKANDY